MISQIFVTVSHDKMLESVVQTWDFGSVGQKQCHTFIIEILLRVVYILLHEEDIFNLCIFPISQIKFIIFIKFVLF